MAFTANIGVADKNPLGALRGFLGDILKTEDIQAILVEAYCTQDTAVMANVAGPRETIWLAGAPLDGFLFWVPAFGRVGLGLNVISYAGMIRLSIATDRGLVPDPERIAAGFETEFETFLSLANQFEAEKIIDSEGEDPFEAMSAMLDDALKALDELLEG